MKYLIMLLVLIGLGVGGYFFFMQSNKTVSNEVATPSADTNCTQGLNGNSGDNYCSNYRSTASKCRPGLPNTYPDGCTK